jgi:hypothetical protein
MKIDNRENDYQDAPGSKFVQQMRQIKMKRLRPMNCFAKARRKFAHDNFIEKSGLKKNSADHPQEKDTQRRDPRPPAAPGADAGLEHPATLVGSPTPATAGARH